MPTKKDDLVSRMYKEIMKPGTKVTFIDVNGNKGRGTYSTTKISTGSHCVENCVFEGNMFSDFCWATSITEIKEVCEYCGGTGVVNADVDDGEGHLMKGVGAEEKCICQIEK